MAKSTSRSSGGSSKRRSGGGSRRGGSSSRGSRGSSSAGSQMTTDHDQIREWAEARGAKPSCVRGTGGGGDTGMIRLDFPGFSGEESLQAISWDEWFDQFDENNLALLYQETTKGGEQSNFNKLVSRTKPTRGSRPRGASAGGRKSTSPSRADGRQPGKSARAGGKSSAGASRPGSKASGKRRGK